MRARLGIGIAAGCLGLTLPLLARTSVAPAFLGITQWFNTPAPLQTPALKGKVVVVDFWTYSCINCIRSMPYLKSWYAKYRGEGLEIIGVHTPEFHFEKDGANVQAAVQKFGLPYPVAMDNDYKTWDAFASRSWPSIYVVDRDGVIRYRHIGEGNYAEIEKQIQQLLAENNPRFTPPAPTSASDADADFARIKTPEIFFGLFRLAALGNGETVRPGETQTFKLPAALKKNKAYVSGTWRTAQEYIELMATDGHIAVRYDANKANLVVAVPGGGPLHAEILVDGQPAGALKGDDLLVDNGRTTLSMPASRMYNLTRGAYASHVLDIRFHEPGVRVYTLTFG